MFQRRESVGRFIRHAIIKNKKRICTIDGQYFEPNHLFKIVIDCDFASTIVAYSLWKRTDKIGKHMGNRLKPKFIRIDPKSNELKNFEIISGTI